MRRVLVAGAFAFALVAMADAAPSIVVSSFVQRGERVLVDYSLVGGPAIVTVDFLTNGVSIGEANFANVSGDVNQIVSKSSGSIVWRPSDSKTA